MGARTICGHYEVGEAFGWGAGGKLATYRGRDTTTGAAVAIAELRPEFFRDPTVRDDYEYGLAKIAPLDHPGVLNVLAHETDAAGERLSYVSEFLDGGANLARVLQDGLVLSERTAVGVARQLLDALAHTHAQGIWYGNVKTSNVLVTPGCERAVLCALPKPPFEFTSITQLGAYLGFPFAWAPEFLATGTFDARADVYGVGLILYELCAGRLPFQASPHLGMMFASIMNQDLPSVITLNPEVTPKLAEVIAMAVAKDPARRYASATAMADALGKVQARSTPLLARGRLHEIVAAAMPMPLAHTCASIQHQVDPGQRLGRLVDTAQAAIELLAAACLAERIKGKVQPLLPKGLSPETLGRPSLGHWVQLLRDGTKGTKAVVLLELDGVMVDERGKPTTAAQAIGELVELRNEVRHGVTIGATAAQKKLEESQPILDRLLAELIFLRDYRLFVPRSMDFEDERFVCEVRMLRGADSTPRRETLRLAEPVKVGQVYLTDANQQRLLSLHPLLVLAPCPTCEDEELFFYESASADRAHYLSFQKGHLLASEPLLAALEKAGVLAAAT